MVTYDSLNNVEPQARSFADGLGGKKGFEDTPLDILWNARAIVANLHHNIVRLKTSSHAKHLGNIRAIVIHRV